MKHKPNCAIYDAMRDTCDCIGRAKSLQEQLAAAQEIIEGYGLNAHQKTECVREAKIAHMGKTIVAQQARIAELMEGINEILIHEDDGTHYIMAGNLLAGRFKDNLSALHENNARVLEEAASKHSAGYVSADRLNKMAAEYRAKAGG